MNFLEETSSHLDRRRRGRRLRMIIDVTSSLIRNERSITHREARTLVRCAEKAIMELFPQQRRKYELLVRPYFDRLLLERWPAEEFSVDSDRELVN